MNQSWLDRFSAHSTPAPSPPPRRSYSPAQRKQSHLAPSALPPRPSLSQTSSSLSLASETSGSRFQSQARANGSSLKNQINLPPPENVPDPLVVLSRLVGKPADNASTHAVVSLEGKPDLAEDVDFGGLSLQEFVDRDSGRLSVSNDNQIYSEQSLEEYERDRRKFEELHKSILACDGVLESVEKYLSSFQSDLGAVSAEIETLQSRSTAMNAKLENRKKVEVLLGPVVEQVSISPVVVKKIIDGPMDEAWAHALQDLQARSNMLESTSKEPRNIKALDDLRPLLEDLSDTAVERIRNHLVSQIKALRSPNINAQVIQQNGILKYRDLYAFLAKRQHQLAEDITQAYVNTIRWYYVTHFTRYQQSLRKMKLYTTDSHDVLGEDSRRQNRSMISGTKSAISPLPDVFNLGRRIDTLRAPAPAALPSYVAEEESSKAASHNIETPFLALNLALIDNASFEYSFLSTFFSTTTSHQKIIAAFSSIFSSTLELATATTKSLITDTYDALGVLLLVRLTQHFAFTLQRRKVPALESYINGTSMLLWPRYQVILDAHCESLRRLTASLPTRGSGAAASALASFGGGVVGDISTAPHPVTQRFANFVHGVLALSSEAGDDEPVANSLGRLRSEYEAFLGKMGLGFGPGEKGKRERGKFLANNYSLVLTVIAEVGGRLAEEQRAHFERLRAGV